MNLAIKCGKTILAGLAVAITATGEGNGLSPLALSLIVAAFTVIFASLLAFMVRQNKRLRDTELLCAELQVKICPLWARVQAQISEDLHHPGARYLEMDGLLEKLEALTISPAERVHLKHLLIVRSNDQASDIGELQRMKARIMLQVMDLVLVEAANGAH